LDGGYSLRFAMKPRRMMFDRVASIRSLVPAGMDTVLNRRSVLMAPSKILRRVVRYAEILTNSERATDPVDATSDCGQLKSEKILDADQTRCAIRSAIARPIFIVSSMSLATVELHLGRPVANLWSKYVFGKAGTDSEGSEQCASVNET
jgi:hypothetical protein